MPCKKCMIDPLSGMNLAYSYVPVQVFGDTYSAEKALKRGTIFPELDLPFGIYGNNFDTEKKCCPVKGAEEYESGQCK